MVDGLAIVDGDILYGTETEFRSKIVPDFKIINVTEAPAELPPPPPLRMRRGKRSNSIFPGSKSLWPNNQVRFKFATSDAKTKLGPFVTTATSRWKSVVSCLSFKEEPVSATLSPDVITINFDKIGCFTTQVGHTPGQNLQMNLNLATCGFNAATHEFGMSDVTTWKSRKLTLSRPCSRTPTRAKALGQRVIHPFPMPEPG